MALVRNLFGDTILQDLLQAYTTLATAYLRHRGGVDFESNEVDCCSLDAAVCATESYVDLRDARHRCNLIENDEERPGEIFNNLGHMFVLLQSMSILSQSLQFIPTFCSPTQQADHEGSRIADLDGSNWALEAYGGGNFKNNGKLAKDLRTLQGRAMRGHRTFLAFRTISFPIATNWHPNDRQAVQQRCSPAHGGPFTSSCLAQMKGQSNGVTVIEVFDITVIDQ